MCMDFKKKWPQLDTYAQIKVNEQSLYCCSTYFSHSSVFNNEHNPYPKMSVKLSLQASGTLNYS